MASYRCSICTIDWPLKKEFKRCPQCELTTTRFYNITPISSEEAESLKLHAEFERFYAKWDEEHSPDRLAV